GGVGGRDVADPADGLWAATAVDLQSAPGAPRVSDGSHFGGEPGRSGVSVCKPEHDDRPVRTAAGAGTAFARRGQRGADDAGAIGRDIPDVATHAFERRRCERDDDGGNAGRGEGVRLPDGGGAVFQCGRYADIANSGGGERGVRASL